MDKKSISELRRRLKKDSCTFTKICGCYVDDKKNKVTNIDEIFGNLEDDEYYKYLEIGKKILSTNLGNNLLELEFPLEEEKPGGHQQFLMGLKKSELKDEGLLNAFYDNIIEQYNSLGNYLILLYHDVYDVMTKTSDNANLDESEEVYEYIICAICPMILSKPGLGYKKDDNKISTLNREWMVGMPESGFIFPGFNERSSDIHCVHMYTNDPKEPHTEIMENILGCKEKLTFAQKQNALGELVLEATSPEVARDVIDTMNIELAGISVDEPELNVSKEHIKNALEYAGLGNEKAENIGETYVSNMKDELPTLEEIVPTKAAKVIKDNNEKVLLKEEIKELNRKISQISDNDENDIFIKVSPDKKEKIRKEEINGETCVVIPVSTNDNIKITE